MFPFQSGFLAFLTCVASDFLALAAFSLVYDLYIKFETVFVAFVAVVAFIARTHTLD